MIWLTVHQCCMCHLSLLRSSSWSGWLFTNVVCVTWVYYDHHHDLVDCSPMLYVSLEFTTIIIMILLTVRQCCMCHLSLPHGLRVSVAHIALLVFVFTLLIPCFEIRCKFRIETIFGLSLPSVDCMTGVSYFWCLCMPTYNSVQHELTKWLTWRMSFAITWVHSWFFVRSVLLIFLVFWICFVCFVCLRPVCMSNVANVSGMSFLDYHFGLSLTFK